MHADLGAMESARPMHGHAVRARCLPAGDEDVDGAVRGAGPHEPPQLGGADVAQQRSRSAGEQRRGLARERPVTRVADGEDAGMLAVQLPFGNEAIDGGIGDPRLTELTARDAVALKLRDLSETFIPRPTNGDRSTHPEQMDEVRAVIPGNRG